MWPVGLANTRIPTGDYALKSPRSLPRRCRHSHLMSEMIGSHPVPSCILIPRNEFKSRGSLHTYLWTFFPCIGHHRAAGKGHALPISSSFPHEPHHFPLTACGPVGGGGGHHSSRLKSSMPFIHNLALQNIPLSIQPFKMQPQTENEDVTGSPQHNLPTTITNKRTTLSLHEVELNGRFSILHIILEARTTWFMHKFNVSLVFHFYVLRLTSWIWTNPSTEGLKFESPSKWNSYAGFNLEH